MAAFRERMDELAHQVGAGELAGSVTVDQVYAQAIHEGVWETGPLAGHTNHPRHGGEQGFLGRPITERHEQYLHRLAARILDGGVDGAMADAMEDLAGQVAQRAPIEFGDLRQSGHPVVTSDATPVYDRPPRVPRLDRDELDAKRRLSGLRKTTGLPMTAGEPGPQAPGHGRTGLG